MDNTFLVKNSTLIRTATNYATVESLQYGSLLPSLYDNCYEFVKEVNCRHFNTGIKIKIDSLPDSLEISHNTPILTYQTEPELAFIPVPAVAITKYSSIVCPIRKSCDLAQDAVIPLIEYSKPAGIFLSSGYFTPDELICVSKPRKTLKETLSQYQACFASDSCTINNSDLKSALRIIFSSGGVNPAVFNLDRSAKLMFLGGLLEAQAFYQMDGNILCPIENKVLGLQLLELIWSTNTSAAFIKTPQEAYTYALIIQTTPFIEEVIEQLPKIKKEYKIPEQKFGENWVLLSPSSISDIIWGDSPVYNIQTIWNYGYVGNMIAIGKNPSEMEPSEV
jgi:hypothetical protein